MGVGVLCTCIGCALVYKCSLRFRILPFLIPRIQNNLFSDMWDYDDFPSVSNSKKIWNIPGLEIFWCYNCWNLHMFILGFALLRYNCSIKGSLSSINNNKPPDNKICCLQDSSAGVVSIRQNISTEGIRCNIHSLKKHFKHSQVWVHSESKFHFCCCTPNDPLIVGLSVTPITLKITNIS